MSLPDGRISLGGRKDFWARCRSEAYRAIAEKLKHQYAIAGLPTDQVRRRLGLTLQYMVSGFLPTDELGPDRQYRRMEVYQCPPIQTDRPEFVRAEQLLNFIV
jgi:hypothetical protein